MAAVVHQAAADKHRGGQLIQLRQLSHRVEHDDVGPRLRVDRQLRTPYRDESGVAGEAFDLAEALGLPRRQHRQRARQLLPDPRERAEHGGFLAAHRAAGDDDGAIRGEPEEPQHALARLAVGRRGRQFQRVELQTACDRHVRGIRAELDETARRFLALDAEAIDIGQHPAEERADHPVAPVGARRDAPVDHHGLHPAPAAFVQQVRPDLGLHHDEQTGPHQVQRAAHDERPVERKVEDRVDVREAVPRDLLPGNRRRRQKEAQARITGFEIGRQGAGGERLADRHGVDPDRFLRVDVERDRQEAEALAEAADVLLVPDGLVQEVRRHDDEDDERQQAVGEVHRGGLL